MVQKVNSFEGQTSGAAATPTNSAASGDAFAAVYLNGMTITYSSSNVAHGSRSLSLAGGATSGNRGYVSYALTAAQYSARVYHYGPLPTGTGAAATHDLIQVRNAAGQVALVSYLPSGKINVQDASGVNYLSTVVLNTNQMYRFEVTFQSGASGSIMLKVFTGDSTTALFTTNPSNINVGTGSFTEFRVGKVNGTATVGTFYIDDIALRDNLTLWGPVVAASSPPTVNAQASVSGTTAVLSSTFTTWNSAVPTYAWSQTAGPAVTLSTPTASGFTLSGLAAGDYTFRLSITDSVGATAVDTVSFTVAASGGGGGGGSPTTVLNMFHDVFVIDATGSTASAGGALSWTISPNPGLTTLKPGIWVGLSPSVATVFTVQTTEAGVGTNSASVTVPAKPASSSGGTGIQILVATNDSTAGGVFA